MIKLCILLILSILARESFAVEATKARIVQKLIEGPVKLRNMNYSETLVPSVYEKDTFKCVRLDTFKTVSENEYKWIFEHTGTDLNFRIKHMQSGKYLISDIDYTEDDDEKSYVYLADSNDNTKYFNRTNIWYLIPIKTNVYDEFYIKSWFHNTYLVGRQKDPSPTRYVYSQYEKQMWQVIFEDDSINLNGNK